MSFRQRNLLSVFPTEAIAKAQGLTVATFRKVPEQAVRKERPQW